MFVENYVKLHKIRGAYIDQLTKSEFINVEGWKDFAIGDSLIFSHRNNYYTKEKFTEGMHSHEYYELIIYLSGAVEYINENSSFIPSAPCAVWFKPGEMHTSRLLNTSNYERAVLYFSKNFFEFDDTVTPIIDFTLNNSSFALDLNNASDIILLCERADQILRTDLEYKSLCAKTFITELFILLNNNNRLVLSAPLIDDMSKIKNFIDCEYHSIKSVDQIAKHFYLSREHLSRQFKKYFNVSVYGYISSRRIAESIKLLKNNSVTTCAYAVGFNSMSSFISTFKLYTGLTPSEYKKGLINKKG